jgi:hypothetical protein
VHTPEGTVYQHQNMLISLMEGPLGANHEFGHKNKLIIPKNILGKEVILKLLTKISRRGKIFFQTSLFLQAIFV